jgi:hypothetical protein
MKKIFGEHMGPAEMAEVMERWLNGTSSAYEWDDLTQEIGGVRDKEIRAILHEAERNGALVHESEYSTNVRARAALAACAAKLRELANRRSGR